MTHIASSIIDFILNCLSYLVLYWCVRTIKPLRMHVFIPFVTGIVLCIILFPGIPSFLLPVISYLLILVSINGSLREVFRDFVLVLIIHECVYGLWDSFLSGFSIHLAAGRLPQQIAALVTYVLILLVKPPVRKRLLSARPQQVPGTRTVTWLYYVVILLSFLMTSVVALLSFLLPGMQNANVQHITKVVLPLSYIGVGGISLVYIYISSLYQHFISVYQHEQMSHKMIQDYYKLLLEKENDTRAYRHDIGNHLICLQEMLKNGQVENAVDYLQTMQKTVQDIKERVSITGNALLDAITNYYQNYLPDKSILTVTGVLPEELPINAYYLNTVYANLLQNAVESALALFEEGDTPYIKVETNATTSYFHFSIKNCSPRSRRRNYLHNENSFLMHGFGQRNVQKALQRIGGTMEKEEGTQTYAVTVHIPFEDTNNAHQIT